MSLSVYTHEVIKLSKKADISHYTPKRPGLGPADPREYVLCLKANPEKPLPPGLFHSISDPTKVTCPDCLEWMHA